MKQLLRLLLATATLSTAAAPLYAEGPPPPPPSGPTGPAAPNTPTAPTTEKMWSRININAIKPTLSARNVYALRGMHSNGVRGGWTMETSYLINDATKTIQITVAAHAPKGSRTTRNLDPVDVKVDITELAGAAYSGAPGKYDVIVVDRDGKELVRTVYEIKAQPAPKS
ncbi:MAG: hypothetical protein M3680_09470 [Myxococcota bacterium]|nr:hypothetical protein [Myxococcota bacterium]